MILVGVSLIKFVPFSPVVDPVTLSVTPLSLSFRCLPLVLMLTRFLRGRKSLLSGARVVGAFPGEEQVVLWTMDPVPVKTVRWERTLRGMLRGAPRTKSMPPPPERLHLVPRPWVPPVALQRVVVRAPVKATWSLLSFVRRPLVEGRGACTSGRLLPSLVKFREV